MVCCRKSIRRIAILSLATAVSVGPVWAQVLFGDNSQSSSASQYNTKAIKYLKSGQRKDAIAVLQSALKQHPNDATIYANLGFIYLELGDPQSAWQYYSRAVKLRSDSGLIWLGLARAYADSGDYDNALKIIKEQKRRFGTDPRFTLESTKIVKKIVEKGAVISSSGSPLSSADTSEYVNLRARVLSLHKQGKYKESLALLNAEKTRLDTNYKYHSLLSYTLAKTKKYSEAVQESKKAFELNPSESRLLLNVMACQTEAGDLDGLQDTRRRFVKLFPDSKYKSDMKSEIEYYDRDFANTKAIENRKIPSTMRRPFSVADMPLKVFVHDRLKGRTVWTAGGGKQNDINYSLLIERAMQDWSNASGKRITFVFTDTVSNANIECLWTTKRQDLDLSFAAGVTSYRANEYGKLKALIRLLAKTPENRLTADGFSEVCLHELGHALGLSHSSSPVDIMYFSTSREVAEGGKARSLSRTDIDRLNKLYVNFR